MWCILACAVFAGALAKTNVTEAQASERRLLGMPSLFGNAAHTIQGGICNTFGGGRRLSGADFMGMSKGSIAQMLSDSGMTQSQVAQVRSASSAGELGQAISDLGFDTKSLASLADAFGFQHAVPVAEGEAIAGVAAAAGAAAAPETFGASMIGAMAATAALKHTVPHVCGQPGGEQKAQQAIQNARGRALQEVPSGSSATTGSPQCGEYPQVDFCRSMGLRNPVAYAISKDAADQSLVRQTAVSIQHMWTNLKTDSVMRQVLESSSQCDSTLREGICLDAFPPCNRAYADACTVTCTSFQACLLDTFNEPGRARNLFQQKKAYIVQDCMSKCKAGSTIIEHSALYEQLVEKLPSGLSSPFGALALCGLLITAFALTAMWKRRGVSNSALLLVPKDELMDPEQSNSDEPAEE